MSTTRPESALSPDSLTAERSARTSPAPSPSPKVPRLTPWETGHTTGKLVIIVG
nr:hypothetical protein [Lentzea waywayandensis]